MGVHTAIRSPSRGPDAHRQGIPDDARTLDRGLREIGVETGDPNVQFAGHPQDGRLVIIEMNPRVSRSSALASKATGFRSPSRRQAAVGYTLTRSPTTSRAADARLVRADHRLRRHQDPALRLREIPRRRARAHHLDEVGRRGDGDRPHLPGVAAEGAALARDRPERLDEITIEGLGQGDDKNAIRASLGTPTPDRILNVAQAMRLGVSDDQIHCELQDRSVVSWPRSAASSMPKRRIRQKGLPTTPGALRRLKGMGFSDARLAKLTGLEPDEVTARRRALGVRPVFKRIDTCAAGVRLAHRLYVLDLRDALRRQGGRRGRAVGCQEGHHPGRRPEPHRPGHRIRLLLLVMRPSP